MISRLPSATRTDTLFPYTTLSRAVDGGDAVAYRFGKLAVQHRRDTASELDDLEAADQLALGVGEHLAMLGGDQRRQPVEIALDEVAEAEERAGADMQIGRASCRERVCQYG